MLPKFKEQKALTAILYVAHALNSKAPEKRADLYKLQKVLYFADRKHIAKYGRSITGDFYVAMKDGPVPSKTYDMLKQVRGDGYYNSTAEFLNLLNDSIHFIENITIVPQKQANIKDLSESDIDALDKAIEQLKNLTFDQIKKLSHDSAYKDADESNNIPIASVAKAGGADDRMISYLNTWIENQALLVGE
jgi:uncharacterized phage-associated protein